jgi:hypothetical protein
MGQKQTYAANVRKGWKVDIARGWVFRSYWSVRLLLVGILVGVLSPSAAAAAVQPSAVPVCQIAHDAAKLIGKRVRVSGYIWDLSSHGFVLTSKRRDCNVGQLGLWTEDVDSSPTWRSAFANSLGPKRAVLVGTVRWQHARFGKGRNPALTVERIEYLGRREADLKDF